MAKCFWCGKEVKNPAAFFDTGKGPLYLCSSCLQGQVDAKSQNANPNRSEAIGAAVSRLRKNG